MKNVLFFQVSALIVQFLKCTKLFQSIKKYKIFYNATLFLKFEKSEANIRVDRHATEACVSVLPHSRLSFTAVASQFISVVSFSKNG